MVEKRFVLKEELGLHARPAAMLMAKLLPFVSQVDMNCKDRWADAKDAVGILGLEGKAGDTVMVRAIGPDEDEAMLEVKKIFDMEGAEEI